MKNVGVIGLGYVGLPLSRRAHEVGFTVYGFDTDQTLLNKLQEEEYFAGLSLQPSAKEMIDTFIVCVPTPIKGDKSPDLAYINSALKSVGSALTKGQLVIIESTVFPGYSDTIGRRILEKASGLSAGKDFFLVHCPERINPGDEEWSVANIPRVLGGINSLSAIHASTFYSKITSGQVHLVTNMAEAEASKMVENAFRDINIAFVNELARSFDGTDVNIHKVLDAAATKPFGYMRFSPGMGVGGHCIPVDPHYIISAARQRGFEHSFLQLARSINDGMIDYIIDKVIRLIDENRITTPRIGILGLTYKANIPDTRESQSLRLIQHLRSRGFLVKEYDPYVETPVSSKEELLDWANVIITAVPHKAFGKLSADINKKQNIRIVIDTTNTIQAEDLQYAKYGGVGV